MTYSEMKDSGVFWIGKIPSHWHCQRLKYLFAIKKEIAGELGFTVLSITQQGIKPKDMSDRGQFSLDYSKYQLVKPGDFAMNHMDLLTGGVDISKYSGVTSPDYRVFYSRNPDSICADYYKYVFQVCYRQRIFYGLGQGVAGFGRWRLPADMFLNFSWPTPPLQEQIHIAQVLNEQCATIDAIVDEVKASIEEYKRWKASVIYQAVTKGLDPDTPMKDSGVSWIGEIPATWDTCAIKRFSSKIGSGKTPSGGAEVYSDTGVIFLRSQNVYNEGLRLSDVSHISPEIDDSMSNTRVRYNDVLLNITGGSMGRCCLFDLTDTQANVNQHVCIIRTVAEMVRPEFLRYFWISESGPMAIGQYQMGGNRPGLNFEQIGNTKIPLCSPDEQDGIIRYLDRRCKAIDNLIEEKQSLIAELEAYKKSLIYEAVTGKRKVG